MGIKIRIIKRGIKKVLKNILLLIITLILIYMAGEFTTRAILYKDGNPFRIEYQLNPEGFRDYDYNLQKPDNTFRIIVLGDSFTFGQGIYKTEDTNPKKLEKLLNKNAEEKRYEVLNFGQRGYNTNDELKTLIDRGLRYEPDLVIVNFYIDDADFEGYEGIDPVGNKLKQMYPQLEKNNKKFPHFYYFILRQLSSLINKNKILKSNHYLIHLKEVYQGKNWEEEKELLKEIKDLGDKHNFKTTIVIFPILSDHSNKYGLKDTYSTIQKELKQKGFPVLNLYDYYDKYNFESLWINIWDSHPNEKGHEIAAKSIYNFLIQEKFIPDAEKHQFFSV